MFGDKKKELLINQLNLCLTTGRRLDQLKKYNEAIYYFDQAMEAEADDGVSVLVARSKAYSALSNHTKAREDAELAVQRQPEKPCVLENDAYTLYEMDRFEQALVEYHQGLRIRQKPDYFQNGVLVATETVENCVGRHADDLFRYDHLGSTVLQIWLKQHLLLKPWIIEKDVNALKEQKRREQSERFFAQRYLGHLNNDKKFLLSCRNNTQLYCGEIDSYNALQNVLIDALAKVNRRQKTLMRLKPYYIHKLNESALKISPKLRQKQEDSKRREELAAAQIVFQKLHAAREAQRNHDTVLCLRVSERAKEFVKNQPLRLLRSKSVYVNSIYNILGDLYLGMKEFIPGWTQEENDFRILYMLGVDVVNECAEEHLRRTFLPYIYDPRKLLEDSEKEMAQSSTHLERAFLYHEMSRSCGQLGRHELARTMGRRCAQEARPAKSPVWTINGMFMVARFESLQRNYVDAKNTLNESIEVAKKLNNQDWSNFLMRALQLLEFSATVSVDRNIILAKRQKDMLESMPNRSMKMKMGLIFTNMNRQPPSRRMMLVPGVMPSQAKKSKKSKRKPRQSETVNRGNVRDRRRNEHPDFIRTLEFRIRPKAVRSFQ